MIKLIEVLTIIILYAIPAEATLNEVDRMSIYNRNVLTNGGFENGRAAWAASGGSFAVTTTNPMTGLAHATWDSSGSSQTLTSTAVSIPAGQYGRNAIAACLITTPSGTATHTIQAYDGSNILASSTITSSTTPTRNAVNFIMPSSGNISLRLVSVAADEPSISIDSCFVGPAEGYNLASVSQATFVGNAYIPVTALCASWTVTSTTPVGFAADTDCPGPTIELNPGPGTIQTTDSDLPRFTVNNLPPGTYEVTMFGGTIVNASSAVNSIYIYDGTSVGTNHYSTNPNGVQTGYSVTAIFSYTTSGNRSFELYGAANTGTMTLRNSTGTERVNFQIKRFPNSNEQTYRPDAIANSWSGYHASGCNWTRTNTAYGDFGGDAAGCSLVELTNTSFGTVATTSDGNPTPGLTFTPNRAGKYEACVTARISGGTAGADQGYILLDGSTQIAEWFRSQVSGSKESMTLCGMFSATSTSAKTIKLQGKSTSGAVNINPSNESVMTWNIKQIDMSIPTPVLVNSVVTASNGIVGIYAADVSTTDVVSNEVGGDWINGNCTNATTGRASCTINANICSATPVCTASTTEDLVNATSVDFVTKTSTSLVIETRGTAGAYDGAFNLICVCQK
jgi:hypothetical protein